MKHQITRSSLLAASLAALLAAACSAADPTPTATQTDEARVSAPSQEAPQEAALTQPPMTTSSSTDPTPEPEPTPAAESAAKPEPTAPAPAPTTEPTEPAREVATLGAGCFWCIEAVLEQVDGVESVVSGYMGGETLNPTYKDICTGQTGHAEVVQVTFDPTILPYKDLLDWFWRSHDPTTLNRQGNDRGTQYRSAIFTHSPAQRATANISKTDVQPTFDDPIVTQIADAATFYPAEAYHQGYYFDNQNQGYCRAIIAPKLKKLGLKY